MFFFFNQNFYSFPERKSFRITWLAITGRRHAGRHARPRGGLPPRAACLSWLQVRLARSAGTRPVPCAPSVFRPARGAVVTTQGFGSTPPEEEESGPRPRDQAAGQGPGAPTPAPRPPPPARLQRLLAMRHCAWGTLDSALRGPSSAAGSHFSLCSQLRKLRLEADPSP